MQLWAESNGSASSAIILVVLLAVVFFVLFRTRRQVNNAGQAKPAPRATAQLGVAPGRPARSSNEFQHWEVEMHDLARDLSAQLDSKMAALQQLIMLADERLARLERLAGDTHESQDRTVVNQATALTAAMRSPAGAATGGRYDDIYKLADTGLSAAQIATQLGQPIGEVELILSLRRRDS